MGFVESRIRSNNYFQPIFLSLLLFLSLKYSIYLFFPINDYIIFLITILYAILNIISSNIEFYKSNKITGLFQEFSSIIIFALLIYMIISLIVFIFKIPLPYSRFFLLILLLIVFYGYYNAHKLIVKEEILYFNNLKENMDIAHISDVHIGSIRDKNLVKKLVNKLEEVNPDIAIISGDLADGYASLDENIFEDFKKLKFPIIFTPGNHDLYQGVNNIKRIASNGEIDILDNDFMKFKTLNIYALSFIQNPTNFLEIPNWKNMWNINKEEINLIIYHFPYFWNEFQEEGFNLQISGHTHGCQFYPAILFSKLFFKYNKGLFENKGNYLHVSEGVGTMGPPIRIGTNSSFTILKLRKK